MKKRVLKIILALFFVCVGVFLPLKTGAPSIQGKQVTVFAATLVSDNEVDESEFDKLQGAEAELSGLEDGFGKTGFLEGEENDVFVLILAVLGMVAIAVGISYLVSKLRQSTQQRSRRKKYKNRGIRGIKIGQVYRETEDSEEREEPIVQRKRRYEGLHARLEEKNAALRDQSESEKED
ncbi:MAG: hypothetical protein IJY62_02175 [Clostridia bacterium]|nr:hypothetical protein [Clostridia bacterium]